VDGCSTNSSLQQEKSEASEKGRSARHLLRRENQKKGPIQGVKTKKKTSKRASRENQNGKEKIGLNYKSEETRQGGEGGGVFLKREKITQKEAKRAKKRGDPVQEERKIVAPEKATFSHGSDRREEEGNLHFSCRCKRAVKN